MEVYLYSISKAFLTFPVAALLFTLPFLLTQYRRHGYIHKYRALTLYLLLLYLMNAFYLILLPLPSSFHNNPPDADSYAQWIPFHFIMDIARDTTVQADDLASYLRLLREQAFLQVIFNIALTMPLGFFLRIYFRLRWQIVLGIALGLSLLFEITQVTGIYGLYDYPYRLFDVDDLIMNSAGGMIGHWLALWLSKAMPRFDRLNDQVDLAAKKVSYTRRAVAFICDWTVTLPLVLVLHVLHVPYSYWIAITLYFVLLPLVTNGRTFGKWLVRIRLTGKDTHITLRELVLRYGLFYGLVGGLHEFLLLMAANSYPAPLLLLTAMFLFLLDTILAVHALRCLFNRERKLFYEERSGTSHIIR
ncbi:glycopeptide antibiotics resistance protein [Paenibacillus phyllosphaerae]|uniref:Glycopeptide antibiotics resistance protein n=1 Tax=Paenibacillus phyllosphaerae TaxID=274593 RepID=A0A7W5FML6_9BACL|nr:VanZ family protein [Paenibacillus phyllosphaerae]MBB3110202.1 glycopeptide antibiotics resistance protein [Paenibacillus phyllosphaerae]